VSVRRVVIDGPPNPEPPRTHACDGCGAETAMVNGWWQVKQHGRQYRESPPMLFCSLGCVSRGTDV
jgi:hypothetical protein